jgi:hypothetical protein
MFSWRRSRKQAGEAGHGGHSGEGPVTLSLRDNILTLDPVEVGLAPTARRPQVWGGLMDMGYPGGQWATLVVVGDGTVSMYTSTGGGVIGAGEHPTVAAAGQHWLDALQAGLWLLPAGPLELPGAGQVVIRAMTFDGQRCVEAVEDDLGHGRHPASPLFHQAHAVLTELRLADERRAKG